MKKFLASVLSIGAITILHPTTISAEDNWGYQGCYTPVDGDYFNQVLVHDYVEVARGTLNQGSLEKQFHPCIPTPEACEELGMVFISGNVCSEEYANVPLFKGPSTVHSPRTLDNPTGSPFTVYVFYKDHNEITLDSTTEAHNQGFIQ